MSRTLRLHRYRNLILSLSTAALLTPFSSVAETPFETWVHRYEPDLGNSPSAKAVAIDQRTGHVAVAGFTYVDGVNTQIYYVSVHDPFTGQPLPGWPRTYNSGGGDSEANAVAFDSAGNVIVTGESESSANGFDYFTRKYDRNGNIAWSDRYDRNSGADRALFIAVDAQDNVIVCGRSFDGSISGDDIHTIRYNGDTGDIISQVRYTSDSTRTDYPTGLAIDSAGKVIVCGVTSVGSFDSDFYTGKYTMVAATGTKDWERFHSSADARQDEARDVVVDREDNVIVAGFVRDDANEHRFFARRYNPAGGTSWSQSFPGVGGDFNGGARSVTVDPEGNAFVTGISEVDNFNTTFYTAKLVANTGAIDWSVRGPFPAGEDDTIDVSNLSAVRIEVDPAGNPIIAGSPGIVGDSADYYVAKYASGNDGALLWQKSYKGAFPNEGTDQIKAMAVDDFGNIVITGDSRREAGLLNEILTIKLGSTALATGDPLVGPGIPENAEITQVFNPAAADTGAIAARVTAKAGTKKFGAIVMVGGGGGLSIPAVQGAAAPGIANAEFKSFTDPVMSPNGSIAFVGKVSGVQSSKSTAVWTNAFHPTGNLERALQQGEQVPGMPANVVLKSVSSISLRNGQLLALIKVAGEGISKTNSTVLYGLTDIGSGTPLLQTGQDPITPGGTGPKIKNLTVFTPPKSSAGHGRYHGDARAIARATFDDKSTAVISVTPPGTVSVVAESGADASAFVADATWKAFSLPAIDQAGLRYATLGSLTIGAGDVGKSNDTVIGYRSGANFVNVAREGNPAPGVTGATYVSLLDPLVNNAGRVAFVGTVKGSGVSSKNKTGLWFGLPPSVGLIARTNHDDFPATDGSGADIDARWTGFKSLALPGGAGRGPLFLATIAGPGIKGKNGFGLWALDSSGVVRKLIRVGDELGDLTVKKFVVLQPSAGSIGATRSFSSGGTVAVLVTFSNKSTGVLNIGIP